MGVKVNLFVHPNWRLAERVLEGVNPGSGGFEPDQIVGLSPAAWTEFPTDDRDPRDVAERLVDYCRPVSTGILIVTTMHSFQSNYGPFFVHGTGFSEFVHSYAEVFEDVITAGDVVIISPRAGRMVVVHHNGLIATITGNMYELQ
ncbi:hypothetical protein [Spirillospora sp. NPDC048824]